MCFMTDLSNTVVSLRSVFLTLYEISHGVDVVVMQFAKFAVCHFLTSAHSNQIGNPLDQVV